MTDNVNYIRTLIVEENIVLEILISNLAMWSKQLLKTNFQS